MGSFLVPSWIILTEVDRGRFFFGVLVFFFKLLIFRNNGCGSLKRALGRVDIRAQVLGFRIIMYNGRAHSTLECVELGRVRCRSVN